MTEFLCNIPNAMKSPNAQKSSESIKYVSVLHKIFFNGVLKQVGMPNQQRCKGSMPKSFEEFASASIALNTSEIIQDVPSDMHWQSLSYNSYKSRRVAPNSALVFSSEFYPGSTSDSAIVDNGVLNQLRARDLILADKGFNIFDKLPSGDSIEYNQILNGIFNEGGEKTVLQNLNRENPCRESL